MDRPLLPWQDVSEMLTKLGSADFIASRLATWRQEHLPEPWSQVDLAAAMTAIGYPMNKTSIWKIENPHKESGRRSITVAEAIGFSRVFGKSLAEILLPPDALQEVDGWNHFIAAGEALNAVREAWARYDDEVLAVRARIAARPELAGRIEEYHKAAQAHMESQVRTAWEINEAGTGVSFKRYLESYTATPALLVSRDVLAATPLPANPWSNRP